MVCFHPNVKMNNFPYHPHLQILLYHKLCKSKYAYLHQSHQDCTNSLLYFAHQWQYGEAFFAPSCNHYQSCNTGRSYSFRKIEMDVNSRGYKSTYAFLHCFR